MEMVKSLQDGFGGMHRRAQLALIGVAVVTVLMLFFITRAATHTDWQVVQSNMPLEKVGKAEETLQGEGIDVKVTHGGTSLEVPASKAPDARVALAAAGTGVDSHASYESILDKKSSPIGLTQEQYKLTRQRLLESLIATDIERINGVEGASVRLVLPEDELFSDEESKATASVSVDTLGNGLSGTQSRAIAQLTAGAVKNMKAIDVTIVDEEGNTYSSGNGADSDGGVSNSPMAKLDIEDKYNRKIESQLTGKIEEITGVGNAKVFIRAEINADSAKTESNIYGIGQLSDTTSEASTTAETEDEDAKSAPTTTTTDATAEDGADEDDSTTTTTTTTSTAGATTGSAVVPAGCVPVSSQIENEALSGRGAGSAGTTGTASNTTNTYAGTTGTSSGSNYVKDNANVVCQPSHVRRLVEEAPGAVNAFHIGVIMDEKLSASTEKSASIQAAVENAVRAYIGTDPDNTIDISYAPLPNNDKINEQREKDERRGQLFAYAKWILLLLGMIGVAFYLRKSLNQRTMELLEGGEDEILMLERGYDPIPLKELEAAVSAASSMENQKRVELQKRVEGIVQQKPENVALMLRGWLHDEGAKR